MNKQEVTENVIGKLLDALEQQDLLKDVDPTDYEKIVAVPVQNIIDALYKPDEPMLKWTDLKIGDIVKCKFSKVRHQVNGISEDDKCVFFGGEWTGD